MARQKKPKWTDSSQQELVAMQRELDALRPMFRDFKKTVMKGSAGKMVEREELPPAPEPVPEPSPKKESASILLIRKAKELSDQGKNQAAIAAALDKDEAWVRGSLLIATKLPASAHQAIADSKFSRTAALQLLLANPTKIEEIIAGALKIAEVEGKL